MKLAKITAIALAMVAVCTMSAFSADWNFYGSARVSTFVTDTDNPDTTTLSQGLQSNARIGARVKVSDELNGRFEYGSANGYANIRHLYGEWNFGAGKFLVGQTSTPLTWFYGNQVYGNDNNSFDYGGMNTGRRAMLRLTFGNLKIAAVRPEAKDFGQGTTEVSLPKVEASYRLDMKNVFVDFGAGYQSYEINGGAASYDIDSYIGALGAGVKFANVYIRGLAFLAQNMGPYKMATKVDCDPVLDGTKVIDNESYGFLLVAGAKINDMFSVEAGYSHTEAELDKADSQEDAVDCLYAQTKITLAPGVFIIPEIGMIDHKNDLDGKEQSEIVYYGAKWQINF